MEQSTETIEKRDNAAFFREYFNAVRSGDMAKLAMLFADDIVWHQPGSGALSGTYRGKDEVFGLFKKFMELSGGTFSLDGLEEVMVNGNLVSALVHFKAERDGRRMSMRGVDLMRIEGGRAREVWLFSADQDAEDRFWSG